MAEDNFKYIIRVANVDIPGKKQLVIALKSIKGVGFNLAKMVCNVTNVDYSKQAGYLSEEEVKILTKVLSNPLESEIPNWAVNRRKDYEVGEDRHLLIGSLDFAKDNDIKRMKKIKCLRGARHQKGLPVRGQRTKSNFRRSKGRVVGVKRKK